MGGEAANGEIAIQAGLSDIRDWCKTNRIAVCKNNRKASPGESEGINAYYGITGNFEALQRFEHHVKVFGEDGSAVARNAPWLRGNG